MIIHSGGNAFGLAGRAVRRLGLTPLAAAALVAGLATGAQAGSAAPHSHSALASVSCTSPAACIAVGVRQGFKDMDRIVALGWNGHTWRLQEAVNPRTNRYDDLNSIACPSAAECFAVGSIGSYNRANHAALIESWNGTAWSVQVLGNPKGTENTLLTSVSCGGPATCFAVGNENDNTDLTPGTLLEEWNGTTWSVQPPVPGPRGADLVGLQAVSCVSPSDCTAVGVAGFPRGGQATLAEHFNGHGWTIEPTPALPRSAEPDLNAVSCSGTTCMAAGSELSSSGESALAELFNGTSWSVVSLAQPAGTANLAVNGVACPSATDCYAVGDYGTSPGTAATLIEQWNGQSWAVMPSPNAAGNDWLVGISCTSSQSCMAVGRSAEGTSLSTLALRESAGHWTIVPTPSPA